MSQINLGGASASVQLLGNDNITEDQQFTFPDTGGELVTTTAPAGGQVVGYQQGFWFPTVSCEGTSNIWLNNGQQPTPANQMTNWGASWTRIGNSVTLTWYFTFGVAGNAAATLSVTDLPYRLRDFPGGIHDYEQWDVFVGTISTGQLDTNGPNQLASYMYRGKDGTDSSSDPDGGFIFRIFNIGQTLGTYILGSDIQPDPTTGTVSAHITGAITYITDDTTWTPINGATVQ
jgi:hypothetical protein